MFVIVGVSVVRVLKFGEFVYELLQGRGEVVHPAVVYVQEALVQTVSPAQRNYLRVRKLAVR